ncbi:MAG TPA: c-type cytochrome [Solirubrobacteraceae bacterium]|nr:c-type cytochrome [Solirubrobacteraceae bacterium]
MRRRLTALAAVLCGGLALLQLAAAQGNSQRPTTTAAAAPSASSPAGATTATGAQSALVARGHALFVSSCASCHGMSAQGIRGRAPSLHGVGAMAADFYLQTGRMPLPSPRVQPLRTKPAFPPRQIDALVAYVGSFGGPPIPVVHPSRGSLADGQRLFGLDCAGCHTIQGQGGIVTGAIVPSLNRATPRQVAQAIRIGPYVMPRFGAGELSEGQVDSLARYVQSIQHPDNRGGWGLGRIGPIPEGMVAWLLAAASLLLIARLIGERMPDQRDERAERTGAAHE